MPESATYEAEVKIHRGDNEVIIQGVRDPMVLPPGEARQFAQVLMMAATELEQESDE